MAKRPHLVHFLAILSDESLSIKASITMKENVLAQPLDLPEIPTPKFPIQALRLLNAYRFTIKIIGLNHNHQEIYKKNFESDSFGNFYFKIPLNEERSQIEALEVYEIRKKPGLLLHLGTFIPLKIQNKKKILICDFDKTLVDTKYSTTKEVYYSLIKPIETFPTVASSVHILHNYIKKGFHPFILSASPHFYEDAIRDWLYKNQIYSAGLFLKDYRHIFSFLEGELVTKDIKIQGLYKLNQLLDILLMTGMPDELTLMGDNFESDPTIYVTLLKILIQKEDPWSFWNSLRKKAIFKMKKSQKSQLLNKIYQIDNMAIRKKRLDPNFQPKINIYIRKKSKTDELNLDEDSEFYRKSIRLYEGLYLEQIDKSTFFDWFDLFDKFD